jgi:hypothetical protein
VDVAVAAERDRPFEEGRLNQDLRGPR